MIVRCENADALTDGRLVSPSAERNKGPIAEVLKRVLPKSGCVLEIGSGTGQHIVHFARVIPGLVWQPSERDIDCLRSIAAWLAAEQLDNVKPPLALDVHDKSWLVEQVDAMICINLIHIAPPSAMDALFRGAATSMGSGSPLVLYGPFRRNGRHTSLSNEAFDGLLQAQNAEWGVRNLEDVGQVAAEAGFDLHEVCQLPANNLAVVFLKR